MGWGKRQLVQELLKHSPKKFNNYLNLFWWRSIIFELSSKDLIKQAFLNDFNEELITAYKGLKKIQLI